MPFFGATKPIETARTVRLLSRCDKKTKPVATFSIWSVAYLRENWIEPLGMAGEILVEKRNG
jgi:hypothetical protein